MQDLYLQNLRVEIAGVACGYITFLGASIFLHLQNDVKTSFLALSF